MKLINSTTKTLKDDLPVEIKQGRKVLIAAAYFQFACKFGDFVDFHS